MNEPQPFEIRSPGIAAGVPPMRPFVVDDTGFVRVGLQ